MQSLVFQVLTRLGTVPSTMTMASYNHPLTITELFYMSSTPELQNNKEETLSIVNGRC
jgi:hypothetical protein